MPHGHHKQNIQKKQYQTLLSAKFSTSNSKNEISRTN